jgi:hypothetical protein
VIFGTEESGDVVVARYGWLGEPSKHAGRMLVTPRSGKKDAQRALQDCLRDEPDWRGLLRVEEIDFSATSECANRRFHN